MPTLNVKCWRTSWAPLRHSLAKEGIELAEGMIVVLRGSLDLYRAKGEVSLDPGRDRRHRAAGPDGRAAGRSCCARSRPRACCGATPPCRVPEPPLHVGLVASPGTEGYRDFLGRLIGVGFRVPHLPGQGAGAGRGAPASIARGRALPQPERLRRHRPGARGRLAGRSGRVRHRGRGPCRGRRDQAGVHRDRPHRRRERGRPRREPASASRRPSAANRSSWRPGSGGRRTWPGRPVLARRVPAFLADAQTRDAQARGRLTAAARHQLRVHRERLGTKAAALDGARRARGSNRAKPSCAAQAGRLGPRSKGHLERVAEQLAGWRRLLAAYDVDRQLERGYCLTLTPTGPWCAAPRTLVAGQDIVTRLADGSVHSRVATGGRAETEQTGRGGGSTVSRHRTMPVPVEQLSYTEASRELDAIVDFFEQREVDVDVLVARLERATALIDELDRRLRRTRAQVEELVPRLDALAADAEPGRGTTRMGDVPEDDRVYFRQLLSGRDFARGDMMARQMVNFVYLIGDRATGEAVVVDPAYAVQDLLDILAADGMRLTGVLGTHFHPGPPRRGQMGGWQLEGISTLLEHVQVPVHVQSDELPWVERTTGVGADDLVGHHSGDVVRVGEVEIELIHTPGHTPGQPVLPGRRPPRRRRHALPRGLRPDRLPGLGPAGHVRVTAHPAGPGARRRHPVPGPPVLGGSVAEHGRHPPVELRLPAPLRRGVDGHVRRVSAPEDSSAPGAGCRRTAA